jgi:protein SCO1/2
VAALVAVGAAAGVERLARRAPPPVLWPAPDFALTNRDGRTVRASDLAGHPWLADFIFTRCGASCPLMTQRMARLDRELPRAAGVRLVSFTVDPAHDTPAALARYAASYGASPRWLFLTGGGGEIAAVSRQGFKLGIAPGGGAPDQEAILHSTKMVLVDGRGRIRRYYDLFDAKAMAELPQDLEAVARER